MGRNLNRRLAQIEAFAKNLPERTSDEFRSITPIDTGNARNSTRQRGNEIQANYPYANRLNAGYSRQAPDGMTDPTVNWIRAELRRL